MLSAASTGYVCIRTTFGNRSRLKLLSSLAMRVIFIRAKLMARRRGAVGRDPLLRAGTRVITVKSAAQPVGPRGARL
jgi:hypothetical protein